LMSRFAIGPAWETLVGVNRSSEDCLYVSAVRCAPLHVQTFTEQPTAQRLPHNRPGSQQQAVTCDGIHPCWAIPIRRGE
jgi:hypothetical protein